LKLKWLSSRFLKFLVKTMVLKDWQCSLFWDFVFKFPLKMKNFNFYPILFVAIVQNFAKKNIDFGNRNNNDHSQQSLTKSSYKLDDLGKNFHHPLIFNYGYILNSYFKNLPNFPISFCVNFWTLKSSKITLFQAFKI